MVNKAYEKMLNTIKTAIIKRERERKAGREGSDDDQVEQLEPSCIANGSEKWHNHYGKWYAVSQKIKHSIIYDPATPLLVPRRKAATSTQICTPCSSSTCHNSQKVEAYQMSTDGQINKQKV